MDNEYYNCAFNNLYNIVYNKIIQVIFNFYIIIVDHQRYEYTSNKIKMCEYQGLWYIK